MSHRKRRTRHLLGRGDQETGQHFFGKVPGISMCGIRPARWQAERLSWAGRLAGRSSPGFATAGTLYTKDAGSFKVFWQAQLFLPISAPRPKTMVLVYDLRGPGEISAPSRIEIGLSYRRRRGLLPATIGWRH
jgi:hypothetical protein